MESERRILHVTEAVLLDGRWDMVVVVGEVNSTLPPRSRPPSTTERPITMEQGTNRLGRVRSKEAILAAFAETWGNGASEQRPEGWGGKASVRIADAIESFLGIS